MGPRLGGVGVRLGGVGVPAPAALRSVLSIIIRCRIWSAEDDVVPLGLVDGRDADVRVAVDRAPPTSELIAWCTTAGSARRMLTTRIIWSDSTPA